MLSGSTWKVDNTVQSVRGGRACGLTGLRKGWKPPRVGAFAGCLEGMDAGSRQAQNERTMSGQRGVPVSQPTDTSKLDPCA